MIVGDRPRRLEICTDSPAGVAAAIAGGADRIELCSALEIGGLTPSAGLVAEVRDATRSAGVALVAMVRPRGGDFTYDDAELALAIAEAQALIAQGVDGLVFGAVRDGQVDMAVSAHWMEQVREAAGMPLPCTFHRAIDLLADPVDAVDAITALGFTRILTSGAALRAIDGVDVIARMVGRAASLGGAVSILAGSGVTPANALALCRATGVRELHASASGATDTADQQLVRFGFSAPTMRRTDAGIVMALRTAMDNDI